MANGTRPPGLTEPTSGAVRRLAEPEDRLETGEPMGTISERLLASLDLPAREVSLRDVRMGLGYTAVQVDSGRVGVAYTFRPGPAAGCTVFREPRPLADRKAGEIAPFLASANPVEAALGLATLNAVANGRARGAVEADVLEALELRPSDEVAMVGHFEPLVAPLRRAVRRVRIFELAPRGDGVLPAEEAARGLPECQVALITSTTLLNHTLDGLLAAAGACRSVVLLGASTPLVPSAFRGTSVTHLSGVEVTDPGAILRVVSEGGGMRFFKGHVRKVVLPVPPS